MRKNLVIAVLVAAVIVVLTGILVRSQEPQKPQEKVVVNQHWRVVPDVAPVDLERQLKLLNDAGLEVTQDNIVIVGDKFTIMVFDPVEGEESE